MNSNDLSNLMVAVVAEAKFNHTSRTPSSSPYQQVFALLKKYDEDACIGQTMKRAQESMESDIMYRTNVGYKERKTLENLLCKKRIFDGYFLSKPRRENDR